MYHLYREGSGKRVLLASTMDLTSAQFLAAKLSQDRTDAVAVYGEATGQPRQPLCLFALGVRVELRT